MEKYLIVVEKGDTGYSAYSPDVLGCIATGKTLEKTLDQTTEEIQGDHVEQQRSHCL